MEGHNRGAGVCVLVRGLQCVQECNTRSASTRSGTTGKGWIICRCTPRGGGVGERGGKGDRWGGGGGVPRQKRRGWGVRKCTAGGARGCPGAKNLSLGACTSSPGMCLSNKVGRGAVYQIPSQTTHPPTSNEKKFPNDK